VLPILAPAPAQLLRPSPPARSHAGGRMTFDPKPDDPPLARCHKRGAARHILSAPTIEHNSRPRRYYASAPERKRSPIGLPFKVRHTCTAATLASPIRRPRCSRSQTGTFFPAAI